MKKELIDLAATLQTCIQEVLGSNLSWLKFFKLLPSPSEEMPGWCSISPLPLPSESFPVHPLSYHSRQWQRHKVSYAQNRDLDPVPLLWAGCTCVGRPLPAAQLREVATACQRAARLLHCGSNCRSAHHCALLGCDMASI
jgi:hypothetical protein